MSANSFILAGSTGGTANGYWTGTGVTQIGGMNAVNFTFEQFVNYPKLTRLTLTGTGSMGASALGNFSATATIPLSTFASQPWLIPASVGTSRLFATAGNWTALGSQAMGEATASADGTNLYVNLQAATSAAITSAGVAPNVSFTYLAK